MHKRDLSGTDICDRVITPALLQAGWLKERILREHSFTDGRIIVRILLVMATGTGKTFTAFQIIWRLWKAGQKKRILFLADRNGLVKQTMVNDFRPFGGAMAKLSTAAKTIERCDGSQASIQLALDRQHRINKSHEIYLGLYQAITGPEERQKLYKEFSPEFFDLIVVDECHRGSAAEDSNWREILEYFSTATRIGLTATPKETKYVPNLHYFGEPVYTYSLRQGIADGFLAPYKVIRVHLDLDVEGYRPRSGEVDERGTEIEDRLYNPKDFDRVLVIDARTRRVAPLDQRLPQGQRQPDAENDRVLRGYRARRADAPGADQRKPGSGGRHEAMERGDGHKLASLDALQRRLATMRVHACFSRKRAVQA